MADWGVAVLLWSVPAVLFNTLMLAWRRRWCRHGPRFDGDTFMRRYIWAVVDAGLACLVVGFATSPEHPGNSLFTDVGGIGTPVFLLGYIGIEGVRLFIEDLK